MMKALLWMLANDREDLTLMMSLHLTVLVVPYRVS